MLSAQLRGRRAVFVGGKGGVGKTTVASALALRLAEAGGRVLVASTDPAHNLGHLWDRGVGDDPVRLATMTDGFVDGMEIDPDRTVDRHLATVAGTMRRLLPERMHTAAERHLALSREAPGTHEAAMLERIAEAAELAPGDYDAIVFDTAPTGHTLRLMALPEQLTGWAENLLAGRDRSERFSAALRGLTPRGADRERDPDAELRRILLRRRERFAALRDTLADPHRCGFVVVFTSERLPVAETLQLAERLHELDVDVAALVANRRSPADAGEVLAARRAREDEQLAAVRQHLPGPPVYEIPLLPGDIAGETGLREFADALG